MEKQRNIPELRFPEFEGEWEKKKLGEVAEKITDGTHFSPKSFDHGEFLYITSKNVKDGYMELSNAQYISYEDHTNIYKRCDVKKGDILLTKDGTIGQSCINELEIEFSLLSSVAFIRTLSNYSNYFIYQLIVSDIGQREIESQIAGQALRRITLQKINNFEFHFPSLPEQSKIATFLTAVDEKLQALKKKKSLLKVYKKGVMQKLFSQELRFKPARQSGGSEDGKDFGDWEEKKLGEILKFGNGKDYKHLGEGSIPVFGTGGLMTKVDAFLYEGETVCIGRKGTIDKPMYYNGKIWTVDTLFYTHSFRDAVPKFIFYLFSRINWKLHNEAGGVPSLSKSTIEQIALSLPPVPEQTLIANFLTSLDEKINHTQSEITKTEVWKKGLLQKMFV
jgi:type I restriction enzyme S subunit